MNSRTTYGPRMKKRRRREEEAEEEEEKEEEEEEEISLEEYGSTTGCDTSLSRIELARGSKFTESGGHFSFSSLPSSFALLFFSSLSFSLRLPSLMHHPESSLRH